MFKIVNILLTFAGLYAALGIHIVGYLSSTFLMFKCLPYILARIGADVVIDPPIVNPIPGVTQIVSASVVGRFSNWC